MKCLKFFLVLTLAALGSCLSFNPFGNSSWATGNMETVKGSIRIVSVSAEKSGEWGLLEKEVNDLLPLLFFEEGYVLVSHDGQADIFAEVTVREREYIDGWKTRRSLSAEVRIWDAGDFSGQPLPLSAGRALSGGKQSFASSKTLSAMLRKAIKNAVNGLPGKEY